MMFRAMDKSMKKHATRYCTETLGMDKIMKTEEARMPLDKSVQSYGV